MKKTLSIILATFLTLGNIAFAQNTDDPKAKAILDKVSDKTSGYSTITATFTSILENKQAGMEVKQEGELKLKGTSFHLTLDDYTILSDGTTTWTIAEADNEVYLDNTADLTGEDIKPTEIFTMWEKGFKYAYKAEVTLDGVKCHHINLYPKEAKEKNYHTIKLYINTSNLEIKKVVAMGKAGDTYIYNVKTFDVNQEMPASLFTFNKAKYPGISEIDNRF